jgi:threonyl-tRNA synthetase
LQSGYDVIYTPHIANLDLWKTSGHFDFYRADMFQPLQVDAEQYQLKPMNCPFHCLMFKDAPKSYRDLPLRWAELGTVYRYERSGTLHGLFRVRGFTQDDAHIFCLPAQLEGEIGGVLDLVERVLGTFGFTQYDVMLSTRPAESVGSDDIWEKATAALQGALHKKGWEYTVDAGGGAFYGPKIDIKIRDALGRKWQCSTIQCDFNLPERFQLEYTAADNSKQRPIMVHRAIFGSLERFFGVLIETSAGDFPLWLAPVQLRLLPVVDDALGYCEEVVRMAAALGLRAEVDRSGNRLAKQIRSAEQQKVPLTAVVGAQEVSSRALSLRGRRGVELGTLSTKDSLQKIVDAIAHNTEMVPQEK